MNRLANISSDNINVIRGVEKEEYEHIIKHLTNIYSFEKCNKQIRNVISVKDDIIEAIETNNTSNLMRLISEFTSAFRSFLDHWETYLKREFGKESKEVILFKNATSIEYDNVFAYRFTYELRNYIQHEGFPDTTSNSYIDEFEQRHFSLYFNNKRLLESGHNWKGVKKDLLDENCKLDFLLLLPEIMGSLNRINNCANNNLDVKSLYDSSKEVLTYKELQTAGMILAILNFPPNYPQDLNGEISIHEFPLALAENLLKSITIK